MARAQPNNAREAARNLERAVQAGIRSAEKVLPRIGDQIQATVRASLMSPAAPAPPGAPPARRTGKLAESYQTQRGRTARGYPYVRVFSRDPVARFQEYGTSKMEARPAFRRAVEAARPTITPRIAAAFEAGVRGAARSASRKR